MPKFKQVDKDKSKRSNQSYDCEIFESITQDYILGHIILFNKYNFYPFDIIRDITQEI